MGEKKPREERSSGADLPRPRRQNSDLPRPAVRPTAKTKPKNAPKPASGKRNPSRPARNSHPAAQKASARRPGYDSDTMELRMPPEAMEDDYIDSDAEYEYRRVMQQKHKPDKSGKPTHRTQAPKKKTPKSSKKKQKKSGKKQSSPVMRILKGIAVCFAALFLIYSAGALLLISRLEPLEEEGRTVTSGSLDASYVTNILLIGTDARDVTKEKGRSDSMILMSINSRTQTIYLSSFMRDAYVAIPGHKSNKLNAAYSLGGADLLMDTLEANYDISIDDCLCVSFGGFAGVIDAFGGVEVTLSDSEAKALNTILISEVNTLMGDDRNADLLESGGTYVLNGKQALCYSRIRYVGNADFERTSRQREVMTKLFGQVKSNAVTAVPELISTALPQMGTNMSTGEMYLLSLRVPFAAGYEIEQLQIPAEGTWSSGTEGGQSVLRVDFAANRRLLQETVYAVEKQPETE
ncbi:MAG: LCP family protein [Oscillospiraceae bacterium]|nr:LCP family protein [Oscillospiraceae bacterium]